MNPKVKDHHLLGAGAAACAICCALATLATIAFAGLAFGLVVLTASLLAVWARGHRGSSSATPCAEDGPVEITISGTPPPDSR